MLKLNTVHHGDCMELMNEIDSGSIDMILCDLPYGATQNKDDIPLDLEQLWNHYERIIKPKGIVCLFGQGRFYVELVASNIEIFRYDLVWDKVLTSGFLNANRMPLRRHEQIAIFYKQKGTYNAQKTQGPLNHSKGKLKQCVNQNYGKHNIVESDMSGLKHPHSILQFAKPHPSASEHRTQKPVELFEWLIKTYTNEGDLVLDNCAGSGTTGIACQNTNRNFILMDKSYIMYELIKKRLSQTTLQVTL